MLLEQNVIPFTQLIQDNPPIAVNAAPIVVTNAATLCAVVTLDRLTVGAIFIVTFKLYMLKGAVAGRNEYQVLMQPAGGAFNVDISFLETVLNVPIAGYQVITRTYLCKVTETDTADGTVELYAVSVGSNSSVAIGEAQLSVIQLWG